jgi:hypothetical protein
MKLLLKQVSVQDKFSPFNGLLKDILIDGGIITHIDDVIQVDDVRV